MSVLALADMNVKLGFGIVGSEQGKQGGGYYKETKV